MEAGGVSVESAGAGWVGGLRVDSGRRVGKSVRRRFQGLEAGVVEGAMILTG